MLLNKTDSFNRDKIYKRQVSLSVIFKVASIAINLALVPLYLKVLGEEQYGAWVTLTSIGTWIIFMDIGIGNGLRNKLTIALSNGKAKEAKELISTAYFSLTIIVVIVIALVLIASFFLPIEKVLNVQTINPSVLKTSILIFICALLLNFSLSLINQIIYSLQKSALTSISTLIANLIILAILFMVNFSLIAEDFLFICTMYSLSLILGSAIMSIYIFSGNKHLIPNKISVKKNTLKIYVH